MQSLTVVPWLNFCLIQGKRRTEGITLGLGLGLGLDQGVYYFVTATKNIFF